jgi:DNA-damage-inducible protein J
MAGPKEIHLFLDRQTLAAATAALEGWGLSLPQAVDLLVGRVARDRALPLAPPPSDQEWSWARGRLRWAPELGPHEPVAFTFEERAFFDEALVSLMGLGVSLDAAVRLMLKRVVDGAAAGGGLPFSPNAETRAAMEEARRGDLESFYSVQALMADLHADD